MNAPTSTAVVEKSLSVEAKVSNLVEQESSNLATKSAIGSEKIRSSVARLASSSVNELEGLASELQRMQEFLRSEVGRVQSEIDSVLAGVNIIIETIAPWKSTNDPLAPPKSTGAAHAGGLGSK